MEALGDAGQGMGWTKDMQIHLRAAKRYLKSDYKVQQNKIIKRRKKIYYEGFDNAVID